MTLHTAILDLIATLARLANVHNEVCTGVVLTKNTVAVVIRLFNEAGS